jgi:hypothetical protein
MAGLFEWNNQKEWICARQAEYSLLCPFCSSKLDSVDVENHGHWQLITWGCYGCGWFCEVEPSEVHAFSFAPAILAALPENVKVSASDLARALLVQRDLAFQITPIELEQVVAVTLGSLMKCEAHHVGRSHNGGIDVLLLRDGQIDTVVQVKRRTKPTAVESVSIVREFLGAMYYADSRSGVFVSTGDHFSKEAEKLATTSVVKRKVEKFDLVDCQKLIEMMQLVWIHTDPPWAEYLKARKKDTQQTAAADGLKAAD